MSQMSQGWIFQGRVAGAIALATIAVGAIGLPAHAQANLVGQCRQTNKPTFLYETRGGTNPTPVATLPAETKVTLSDNGVGGLIAISAPRSGFIPAVNLKLCAGNPTPIPAPPASKCRRVLNPPEGLVIRQGASTTTPIVGGVPVDGQVELTTNPATVKVSAEGRSWVEISSPTKGWISNGLRGSRGNLVLCR
ncbi:MAG TPA: SH3 domain-containing protein [Thermosynechococcaceae cyanobacterium]